MSAHDLHRSKPAKLLGLQTVPKLTAARTRIGGDIAADLATALGAEVQRHAETPLVQVVVQRLQDAPRVAHQDARHLNAGKQRSQQGCNLQCWYAVRRACRHASREHDCGEATLSNGRLAMSTSSMGPLRQIARFVCQSEPNVVDHT